MRLLINKVGIGTHNPEVGKIYDFWFEGQLESGKIVKILDEEPYDLRNLENQEIICLLFAGIDENPIENERRDDPAHPVLHGTYLGEYSITKNWKLGRLHERYMLFFSKYHAIKLEDGIIIISPKSAEK